VAEENKRKALLDIVYALEVRFLVYAGPTCVYSLLLCVPCRLWACFSCFSAALHSVCVWVPASL
jgi:hypothetical protein